MEKKVRICDDCKEEIATSKCEICGYDLCSDCNNNSLLKFDDNINLWNIVMCDDCYDKATKIKNVKSLFGKPLKEFLIPILKKSVMLSKLEEGKK